MSGANFNSNSVNDINELLNPVLFQVIGSTPESLREHVEKCNLQGKNNLGSKFIALSVFAASVNKSTVEEFFAGDKMSDLRLSISREFMLNNKLNMTALSLAGHCFMTQDALSTVQYVVAFRKKMGQNSVWDGELAGGSLSETQKKILKEKASTHSKDRAIAFASWFMEYTGLRGSSSSVSQVPPAASAQASSETPSVERTREDSPPIDLGTSAKQQQTAAPDVVGQMRPDLVQYYLSLEGRTRESLQQLINEHGVGRVERNIEKQMQGGSGSVIG